MPGRWSLSSAPSNKAQDRIPPGAWRRPGRRTAGLLTPTGPDRLLVEQGAVTDTDVAHAVGRQLELEFVDLADYALDRVVA